MKKLIYSKNLFLKRNDSVAFELMQKLRGKEITEERIESALYELNYGIYQQVREPVGFYTRITLPAFIIVWIVLFILMPVNYFVTGEWGYQLPKLQNWAKKLGF